MAEDEAQQQFETIPLYKYQAFPAEPSNPADPNKRAWVRDILVEHKLFFATRKDFNDPFDCVVPSLLQIPGTILKRSVEEFLDRNFPGAAPAEWAERRDQLMSVRSLQGLREGIQNGVDQAGIACFCKV